MLRKGEFLQKYILELAHAGEPATIENIKEAEKVYEYIDEQVLKQK